MGFDVRPLTGTFGADVIGLDVSSPLDRATLDQLQKALTEHLVAGLMVPTEGGAVPLTGLVSDAVIHQCRADEGGAAAGAGPAKATGAGRSEGSRAR